MLWRDEACAVTGCRRARVVKGGGKEMVDKLQQFCHLMSFEAAVQNLQQRLVIVDPGNKSSLDIHAAPTWRPLFLPHLFLSLPPITPIAYSPRFGELKNDHVLT